MCVCMCVCVCGWVLPLYAWITYALLDPFTSPKHRFTYQKYSVQSVLLFIIPGMGR